MLSVHERMAATPAGSGLRTPELSASHPADDSSPCCTNLAGATGKILTDELRIEQDKAGHLVNLSLLTKRGSYRIYSATDPEATICNHGRNKQDFGYNVSVLATPNFIYEIQVDTGSRPDGDVIPDLLQSQLAHHDHARKN